MFLDASKAFMRPMEDFPFEIDVPLESQDVGGDLVSFDPVHLEGTYMMADDTVRLEGRLSTVAHAPCAVCLSPVDVPVELEFGETFRKDADEEEDGCFSYEGKQLPLDHMALTLVMINLPMRFKCAGDCKADGVLTAWNEDEKVWAENGEEPQGTYRPFEGLSQLLEEKENKQ